MAAVANTRTEVSGGSKGSSRPASNLRCGWCKKPIKDTVPPNENIDQMGFDGIPVLSSEPGPFKGAVLDRGKWYIWFHHDCHNMHMAVIMVRPQDMPVCNRPGCPHAVTEEGAFCLAHWAELPEQFFDPIVLAMDDQDREGWKAAVRSAVAWYRHRDS